MIESGGTTLTAAQLLGAIALTGLEPGEGSPLGGLGARAVPARLPATDREALKRMGWLEGDTSPRVTAAAMAALSALCRPRAMASLLQGTREAIAALHWCSAKGFGEGELVLYAPNPERDEHIVQLGQTPATIADTLGEQILLGPVDEHVAFHAALAPDELVAMLGALDWLVHARLLAALDRQPSPDLCLAPRPVWEMLVEGRTAYDMGWQVTLFSYLLPFLDFELGEEAVAWALTRLRARGLLTAAGDGRYSPAEPLVELHDAMLPVLSYAGLHVEAQGPSGATGGAHLAILRSRRAILAVQPAVDEGGQRTITVDTVRPAQLADLVFRLGLPEERVAAPSAPAEERQTCPTCGARLAAKRRFCTQCGAALG